MVLADGSLDIDTIGRVGFTVLTGFGVFDENALDGDLGHG
jgi:hypothetical protein